MASSRMFNSELDIDDAERARVALLKLNNFKLKFHNFIRKTGKLATSLDEVAKVFNKAFLDNKTATIAGSAAGVVGGTIGAVGLGLAPFTAGLSLFVSAAGAGVGALGGITAGGAAIGEAFERKNAVKEAEEIMKKFESERNDVIKDCKQITDLLGGKNLNKDFPLWASFITKLIVGSSIISGIGLGQAISEFSLDAVMAGRDVATTALKAGSFAARGLRVAVVGIILIPLYIGFLVHSSYAVHTNKVPDQSKKISKTANQLRASCSSEAEIDDAIKEAINKLMKQY